jgi:hypothetical protein
LLEPSDQGFRLPEAPEGFDLLTGMGFPPFGWKSVQFGDDAQLFLEYLLGKFYAAVGRLDGSGIAAALCILIGEYPQFSEIEVRGGP